jgi:hypothetical protein
MQGEVLNIFGPSTDAAQRDPNYVSEEISGITV